MDSDRAPSRSKGAPTRFKCSKAPWSMLDKRCFMKAEELAAHLRVRPSTVKRWAQAGRIPATRLSRRVLRFNLDEVATALRGGDRAVAQSRGEVSHAR